jgi:UDP-N-acetylglucosamine 2-epimerase
MEQKKRVMLVFGTRPEAIKVAPLVKAFQKHTDRFETVVCVTGQHREMLDQVLHLFDIKPDYDLNMGESTVEVAPTIIDTKGSSNDPFENSAKTSLPKYRLIKN